MFMRSVFVLGAGMTSITRGADVTMRGLTARSFEFALADSTLAINDIRYVYFSNALGASITGQEMIPGQSSVRESGLLGRAPVFNVENACASGSSALHLAWLTVASGQAECVAVIGAEKMTHTTPGRTIAALRGAVPQDDLDELADFTSQGISPSELSGSLFMDIYARLTREYMKDSGATAEDFALVAEKNRLHGSLNPLALFQQPVSVEDVLTSKVIVDPLTMLMCSATSDGAAALIVGSDSIAERLSRPRISIAASVVTSGDGGEDVYAHSAVRRAAVTAYELASLGPNDVDVLELHDATASGEVMAYEELGLCAEGDGPRLVREGHNRLGGRQPVNPSGGLLSRGHPVGATGCAQIVELVQQLRGEAGARQVEGAQIGLAENAGGFVGEDVAAAAVTILRQEP